MDVIGQDVQVEKFDVVSLASIEDGAGYSDLILWIQDARRPNSNTESHHAFGYT